MSRGGRGGGAGRGAFSAGFAGIESRFGLEFEPGAERDDSRDSKPSDTFPPYAVPVAPPLTWREKRAVYHYRTLRARIHDGPLYCNLDASARTYKSYHGRDERQRTPPTAHFDAFSEQDTYTQRFKKKRNVLPDLTTRPFVREFFPRELWRTMGVENEADGADEEGRKNKRLKISTTRFNKWMKDNDEDDENADNNKDGEDEEALDEEDKPEDALDPNKDDDRSDRDEEEVDPDQFEDDDDDDYNAEQYFDDGAGDEAGDDGGAEDDM